MTCIGRAARSLAAGNAAGDVAAWGHAAGNSVNIL